VTLPSGTSVYFVVVQKETIHLCETCLVK